MLEDKEVVNHSPNGVSSAQLRPNRGIRKILIVVGTRPEAIKLASLIKALKNCAGIQVVVCSTGQHREMLAPVLSLFGIEPNFQLDAIERASGLADLTALIVKEITSILLDEEPDWLVVQGDTTSAMASSIAALYARVPVAHVEAGLRTGNLYSPWPEEGNRRIIGVLSDLHFAPTQAAAANLLAEGVLQQRVYVTGNTGIDSLFEARRILQSDPALAAGYQSRFPYLKSERKTILVTGHRRESFGDGFQRICESLSRLAGRTDVQIVYPVHLNPNVKGPVYTYLRDKENIFLMEPLDYLSFVYLMDQCDIVLTDSGGIQEEAPSFGKPVLVMRENTERPEGIQAGCARLVGTKVDDIVAACELLLDDHNAYQAMATVGNPYGDGLAAGRIAKLLSS